MASGEQPHSAVVLEAETAHGTARAAEDDRKRSRAGTDDGGYNSATSATQPTQDGGGKKRKTAGHGSRGVANLTPEQLEKKRANGKFLAASLAALAQRAIRERTKTQIDSLQRQIHELKSQQPQLELQAALRAKEDVESELLDIKRRLASVVSMIQPILSGTDHLPVYPSPGHIYSLRTSQRPAPSSMNNASTPSSASAPSPVPVAPPAQGGHWLSHANDVASTGAADPSPQAAVVQQQLQQYPQAKLLTQQRQELIHGLDLGAERLGLDFLLDYPNQRVARLQNGINGAQDSPQFNHVPMKHDWATGVMQTQGHPSRSQNANSLGGPSSSYSPPAGSLPPDATYAGFSAPVKNCPPTCPLDSLLLDFLQERHQRAAEGLSAQEIIGPRYPSVSSLLNPAVSRFSHPLSKVFTDILQTFPDISALPERVAVLYIMFLIMRWQISPTRENYDRLPEWATPRPSQLFTPHPAWMDHLPFPRMREKLDHRQHNPAGDNFPFENFFIPYTTTLCLNWPYEDIDVLLQSPDTEELMVNPVFERHLRRLENWTLGDAFAKAFPGLADTFNLKSDSADGAVKLAR
ncbi:hypothetical protein CONLIGDRAFT_619148 [Coniochaeta ligniaria NRRL 30616]|uniref:BZIP transcription factor n=1 Tax=Coniochaeta ligniaria NRRL 30616 TaxID=1408157 RepID=A0A1J7JEA5_9PEZI|nr:hypothetical protein CONLIGDRAFT_619148 [Coniochaeta ligniaria NRRL 30616]